MVKPEQLTGCGREFYEGEEAVSFDLEAGKPFYYKWWRQESKNYAVWHCGEPCPYENPHPQLAKITYYCRNRQIEAGLIW